MLCPSEVYLFEEGTSLKLSKRIARIASFVPRGSVVADIGTDHALLPIYLIREGICPRVFACDFYPGPLETAMANVLLFGLGGQIEVRQGNGLQALDPEEVDVIVVAGMGGAKIRDLLSAAPAVLVSVKRLVLQPQGGAVVVRRWLANNNWLLLDEDLVLENERFYEIIVAEPLPEGKDLTVPENELLFEIGPLLLEKRHLLLVPFLQEKVKNAEIILKALRHARTPAAKEMREEWQRKIEFFRRVIEDVS